MNVDPSDGPPQDFYRFTVGGWLDRALIEGMDAALNYGAISAVIGHEVS